MKSDEQLVEALEEATAGLLLMSESDYPFEVIRWSGVDEITSEFIIKQANAPAGTKVETKSVDDFFRASLSEERETAGRYKSLAQLLKENLNGVMAYRVGEINIPVYIIGKHETGSWIGVSSRVIET